MQTFLPYFNWQLIHLIQMEKRSRRKKVNTIAHHHCAFQRKRNISFEKYYCCQETTFKSILSIYLTILTWKQKKICPSHQVNRFRFKERQEEIGSFYQSFVIFPFWFNGKVIRTGGCQKITHEGRKRSS